MDPIGHLAQHSELDCIDLGRPGELVAAFIVMQARDQAAKQKRWMSTPEFMKALLPSAHYEALKFSMLTSWLEGEHESFSVQGLWQVVQSCDQGWKFQNAFG